MQTMFLTQVSTLKFFNSMSKLYMFLLLFLGSGSALLAQHAGFQKTSKEEEKAG